MLHARTRDGSLRAAATREGAKVLVYEGGETLRFSKRAIQAGVAGVMRAMQALKMGTFPRGRVPAHPPLRINESTWVRARKSGVARLEVELGAWVSKGESIGEIVDIFGARVAAITASVEGIVLGLNNNPLVNQGDAMVHIGEHRTPPGERSRSRA
jgi:predicted deacylase